MAANYGQDYYLEKARAGQHTDELWNEAGKLGFIGVNLPEEYGGGGAGMYELSIVMEEMSAAGCPLLLMVVSPAINGTIISKFGTDDQKKRWLPGIADGSITMAFAITEPDAGSNSHRITTTARRDGSDWILNGQKVYISGVDQAQAVLVVGRTQEQAKSGTSGRRCSSCPPTPRASPGPRSTWNWSARRVSSSLPRRRPAACGRTGGLRGRRDRAVVRRPEPRADHGRASAVGMGRFAIDKAVDYVKTRQVWKTPIGAHQGLSHPLAQNHIEIELAKLMMKAATATTAATTSAPPRRPTWQVRRR